ncbi:hypothetical protein [Acidiphilium sp.]|uniref:hypothetical protein n=1 Tax=Acidiphilium sp. TaxID=527 RepID=UPI0025880980|nr:hypothetical protein [Acidiphilium sp.]
MSIYPYTDPMTGLVFLGPPIAHGEVTIVPIAAIPANHGPAINTEGGHHVLGHSESGHHHVLDRVENIERFRDPRSPESENIPISAPLRSYLRVLADKVALKHLKPESNPERHGDQELPPGDYLVTTGVEYTSQGLRRVAD